MLEHAISTQHGVSEEKGFQDSSVQEEIIFRGRLASGGSPVGGLLRSADGPIGNHAEFHNYPDDTKEPGLPFQKDDELHPFGLSWPELKGKPTGQKQPSSISSTIGMPGHLLGHSSRRGSLFAGVPDQNVETWPNLYDKGQIPNADMFRESLDGQDCTHIDNHEMAQQVTYRKLQQQQSRPRNMVSQLTCLNESPLDQEPDRASLHQLMANQPLSDIEHILSLERQRQLAIQHRLQQQQRQKISILEQQSQARQLPLERLFHGRDLGISQSHVDPNMSLDQMVNQNLLRDSQTHLHQTSRHSDPYLEQLIQAKMGHATHLDRQADLLELLQQTRHERFWSFQMLHQEQLQAQQLSMAFRQPYKMGEGRSIGSAWSIDKADQFLRNPVGSQRAHLAASSPPFSHLDKLYQQQQSVHQELLREIEQNLQVQERLKRGLYEPGTLPFKRVMSLQGGGPGVNLDLANAMARLQGLDIQDPNHHMRSAGLGSLSSGADSLHPQHPFVHDDFNTSHFDAEGCWPDNDSRMPNEGIDPPLQQVHLDSKQHKREQQLDEDYSKRLLMAMLHQKSNHQPTQLLNLKDGEPLERSPGLFSGSSSVEHFFNLSPERDAGLANPDIPSVVNMPAELTLIREQAGGIDISGRLNGRSNSGIVMEGKPIYPGISVSSSLRFTNANKSGNSYMDCELSEVEGKNWAPSFEYMAKGSVMEDCASKKAGVAALDGREIPFGSINRQDPIGVAAKQGALYNEKTGQFNSFTEEVDRMPAVLSSGSPVSHPLSSQKGIFDVVIDADTKEMSLTIGTPDGGRIDLGKNATVQASDTSTTKKDKQFRRTKSCSDLDVSERSFIDMLKSSAKYPSQPEAHMTSALESGDGAQGRSGRKRRKKRTQIDPAPHGFEVTSKQKMTGIGEHVPFKNRLQEFTQRASLPSPSYTTVTVNGSCHPPQFRSSVDVDGENYMSLKTFSNKKAAEQDAAKVALEGIYNKIKNGISKKTSISGFPPILQDKIFCKAILHEFADKMNIEKPKYDTVKLEGPVPIFSTSVFFNGVKYVGSPGVNKKEAEQLASRTAVLSILVDSEIGMQLSEVVISKAKLISIVHETIYANECPAVPSAQPDVEATLETSANKGNCQGTSQLVCATGNLVALSISEQSLSKKGGLEDYDQADNVTGNAVSGDVQGQSPAVPNPIDLVPTHAVPGVVEGPSHSVPRYVRKPESSTFSRSVWLPSAAVSSLEEQNPSNASACGRKRKHRRKKKANKEGNEEIDTATQVTELPPNQGNQLDDVLNSNNTNQVKIARSSPSLVSWHPPPKDFIKLNFDGSVKSNCAAAGAILRNEKGDCLKACSYNLGNASIHIAEIMGLKNGILMAIEENVNKIIIEGDNLMVINTICGKWKSPGNIDHIVEDVKMLLEKFQSWEIRHIFREANQAADRVANVGHSITGSMIIRHEDCSKLSEILCNDRLGVAFVRKGS